jgi:hypothetical protein
MKIYWQTLIELTSYFMTSRYRLLLPLVIALSVFGLGLLGLSTVAPIAPFLYPLF